MSSVPIQKVENGDLTFQPIFEQIAKRLEDVRRRAYELFQSRGCEPDREIEDWLQAERDVLGWPALETQENEKQYEFRVALAGLDAKDVEVFASSQEIIVHAQARVKKERSETGMKSAEFATDEVYRRINVPHPIELDRVKATLDNGTLRITAAKTVPEQRGSERPQGRQAKDDRCASAVVS